MEDWSFYDMEELAKMCEEKGLDPKGGRDDLIARLEEAPTEPAEPATEPAEPATEPET